MMIDKFKNLKQLRLALGESRKNVAQILGLSLEMYTLLEYKWPDDEKECTPAMRFAYTTLKQKIDTELDPESLRVLRIQAG